MVDVGLPIGSIYASCLGEALVRVRVPAAHLAAGGQRLRRHSYSQAFDMLLHADEWLEVLCLPDIGVVTAIARAD